MAQFILGSYTFRTKGDAKKTVQHILHNAPLGALLAGDDLDLVNALLDHHPHRDEKLADGMVGIAVRLNNEGYIGRGFHVVRPDGSTASFSYRTALNPSSGEPTIPKACRMAVLPDINAFRDARLAEGPQCCAVSGEPLTPLNTHVDHAGEWPFRRIVKEFIEGAVKEGRSLRLIKREICIVEFADHCPPGQFYRVRLNQCVGLNTRLASAYVHAAASRLATPGSGDKTALPVEPEAKPVGEPKIVIPFVLPTLNDWPAPK